MNINICKSVLLVAFLVVIFSYTSSTTICNSTNAGNSDCAAQSRANDTARDGDYVPPNPMWKLLEMTNAWVGIPPSAQRVIKRVKITFFAKEDTPFKAGCFIGNKPLVYETDNPHELEAVTSFLDHPFRLGASDSTHVGGGAFAFGTIEIITNRDWFTITIHETGFYLGDGPDIHTLFYSWGLAHFLDDLCVHKVGVHIPSDIMHKLTGEFRIIADKKILQELNDRRLRDIPVTQY